MGVTSLMAEISRPAAWSERIAASRPEPGPFTHTSTFFRPSEIASFAADSAEICAANGVLLREPLNPTFPALAQATVWPSMSVIVTIVLLNVDWTWAIPLMPTFRSRFFFGLGAAAGVGVAAVSATRNSPYAPGAFAGARFGAAATLLIAPAVFFGPLRVRALVRVRWPRTGRFFRWRSPRYAPMSIRRLIFIATSLRRAPSTFSCDSITWRSRPVSSSVRPFTRVSGLTPVMERIFCEVERPIPKMYVSAISMRFSFGRSTPAIRAKTLLLSLALLVARVLADDPHDAFAPDHFAVLANLRYGRLHLHDRSLLVSVDDAPAVRIVGRHLHRDLGTGQELDELHPHLARDVCQDLVTVFQLHAKHRVGERLDDRSFDLDDFFFCHSPSRPRSWRGWPARRRRSRRCARSGRTSCDPPSRPSTGPRE